MRNIFKVSILLITVIAISVVVIFILQSYSSNVYSRQIDRLINDTLVEQVEQSTINRPAVHVVELSDTNKPDPFKLLGYELLGPVQLDHLSLIFITKSEEILGDPYITLEEGLKRRMCKVYETSNVNELKIDNLSNKYLYVNSGDIVKGGKQDRTLSYDMILEPNQRDVSVSSFCVERNRWSARGTEEVTSFNSCNYSVSSKELKVASKVAKDQANVWENVDKKKEELDRNISVTYGVSGSVSANASPSSLQLAMESRNVDSLRKDYMSRIPSSILNNPNIVGFAYFINGNFYGIDVYNNKSLFHSLKTKLLQAAVIEAISISNSNKSISDLTSKLKTQLEKSFFITEDVKLNGITKSVTSQAKDNKTSAFTTTDLHEKKWLQLFGINVGLIPKYRYAMTFFNGLNNMNEQIELLYIPFWY